MNVQLKLFILVLCVCLLSACDQKINNDSEGDFIAYSWTGENQQYSNIIPFYWLKTDNLHDMDQFVVDAKVATEKMPEGHRALFSWDLHRSMSYQQNGDFLYEKNGEIAGCHSEQGFKPYRSIWWDNGVQVVRQRFEKFFKAYKQANGKLDVFVLDFEQGFSYWHLRDLADRNYPCGLDAYLDAIQNDARFSAWREQLGFDDLKTMNQWYRIDNDLKWSALVKKHLAGYIDEAVYQPMKKYFPDADFSNYGYYYQKSEMNFPSIYGSYHHRYTDGIHVGTHQSREIYGWADLPESILLENSPYPTTPYNAFRFAVNKNRAMLLSSTVPVSPWVAYKGFSNGFLYDNDYYQELILHILLSGVDYLLYWNPDHHQDFNSTDDGLLNSLIQQVNNITNNRAISFTTDQLVHWLDDVVITNIKFADGQQLSRITVNLEKNQKIEDYVINVNPLKLNIEGLNYDFTGMRILETNKKLSDKGLWLTSTVPN